MLRDEMRKLNQHLPKDRKTLKELLTEDMPNVLAVGGQPIQMRRNELEELSSSLPRDGKDRIRLPLVLLRRRELGPGAFAVLGDPYEEYAVTLLVRSFKGTFEEFKRQRPDPLMFYKPEVVALLRRFHSLVVLGFGLSNLQTP